MKHIKETISNLRQMPEKRRKQLFFAIMAVAVVTLGFFQIKSTINSVNAVAKSVSSVSLKLPLEQNAPIYDTVVPAAAGKEEVQNWQTYSNADYGFQLQYPQEWFIDSSDPANVLISSAPPEDPTSFSAEALQIYAEPVEAQSTIDQVLEKRFRKDTSAYTRENVLIGGQYAVKVKTTCEAVGCGSPEWFVINNGTVYNITSGLDYRPIFDQILSTLTFTSPNIQ